MIKMEDLIPKEATFKLRLTPGKSYTLSPFSLADEIWLREKYGDRIDEILRKGHAKEIAEIAFHQMKDKGPFLKREIKIVNDEGDEKIITLGGAKLLMSLISGQDEKIELIYSLLTTIGVSRPQIDKMSADDEKKSQKKKPTGQK